MILIATHLNAGVPNKSTSLISLMVSVDVEHSVYLLTAVDSKHGACFYFCVS